MKLREYQIRAIEQLYNWFSAGNQGHPCLVLPTGAGKSVIIAALCRDALQNWPETRILMLTHVKELIEQNYAKMRAVWPNAPVGVYSASMRRKELGEPITFAGIQSIRNKSDQIGHVDLVIVDECFSAGTKVSTPTGEKDIDIVRCGDTIYNAFGVGTVLGVSAKPTLETYMLEFSDGKFIECTGNHPFFTEQGWKQARELEVGTYFFGIKGMRLLWENVQSLGQTGPVVTEDHIGMPRENMERAVGLLSVLCKEAEEPDEQSPISLEDEGAFKGNNAQTYQTRRERALAAFASTSIAACPRRGLGSGTCDSDEDASSGDRLSDLLQSGLGKKINDASHRTGWREPLQFRKEISGFEKDGFSDFPRLVSISCVKSEGARTVFNLRVSGHPSFFANGKLVHNCHTISHKDEGGYRSLINDLTEINPNLRVIGLTATPWRLGHGRICDGDALFDDLIEPVSIEELIYLKHLAPLHSKQTEFKFDVHGVKKRGGEYIESELQAAVDTIHNNNAVVEEAIRRAGDRKAWLFFCAGVKHAESIRDILIANGISAACVTGTTPKGERERLLDDFRSGKIRAMTNANVLTTGFDYPDIDYIAMLRPTMSPALYMQMAGRGLRPKSHTDHCLVSDFAQNIDKHGPITNVREPDKKGEGKGEPPVKVCPECQEHVAIAAMTCPACGHQFPPKETIIKRPTGSDIMWGRHDLAMDITSWQFRPHVSRTSGKDMIRVTYYGALSDLPINEYFAIFNGGAGGEVAMKKLTSLCRRSGIDMESDDWRAWCDYATSHGKPPHRITYTMDGQFAKITGRTWE